MGRESPMTAAALGRSKRSRTDFAVQHFTVEGFFSIAFPHEHWDLSEQKILFENSTKLVVHHRPFLVLSYIMRSLENQVARPFKETSTDRASLAINLST